MPTPAGASARTYLDMLMAIASALGTVDNQLTERLAGHQRARVGQPAI